MNVLKFDDGWWLLMVIDGYWWLLIVIDGYWWLLMVIIKILYRTPPTQ